MEKMINKKPSMKLCSFLKRFFCLLSFLVLILVLPASGQTREELERNKQRIEREIQMISRMIEETQKTAELGMNELMMLNNQISRRESLIRNINNEITLLNRRIANHNLSIENLTNELEELREAYANMVRHAYRNRDSFQRLMFIFSSRDFNQAYMRMRYLQQYARHRQMQAEKIMETREKLDEQVATLEREKAEQQQLLARQRSEIENLSSEKARQDRTVNQLKRKERELMSQLREQEKAARELQRAIEEVIAEERRRAQEQARREGKPAPDMFTLTPEEQIISDNFAENKGKLPWPLERGVITSPFGEQPHPVLPGIKISNNGIDISTTEGAEARAIFEGVVSRVVTIPGAYYAVIIRHGEYLSVYSNLKEVRVRNGQRVSTRQVVGVIATESREAKTNLHLEIWKGNEKLDPAQWIARQN